MALPAYRDSEVIHGPWSDLNMHELDLTDPGRPRGVASLREQVTRRALAEAFREPTLTLDDLLTQRTVVCWRCVKALAAHLGHPAALGSLRQLFRAQHPYKALEPGDLADEAQWTMSNEMVALHEAWSKRPLSLMPHGDMERLERVQYLDALHTVARHLSIREGAPDAVLLGKYGLMHLNDPDTLLEAFPHASHMVAWEQKVIEHVADLEPRQGARGCIEYLRRKFALTDSECACILAEARSLAVALNRMTDDERRAIYARRLDEIYQQSQVIDPRAALQATKTAIQMHGLARTTEGGAFDADRDMFDALIAEEEAQDALEYDPDEL